MTECTPLLEINSIDKNTQYSHNNEEKIRMKSTFTLHNNAGYHSTLLNSTDRVINVDQFR